MIIVHKGRTIVECTAKKKKGHAEAQPVENMNRNINGGDDLTTRKHMVLYIAFILYLYLWKPLKFLMICQGYVVISEDF